MIKFRWSDDLILDYRDAEWAVLIQSAAYAVRMTQRTLCPVDAGLRKDAREHPACTGYEWDATFGTQTWRFADGSALVHRTGDTAAGRRSSGWSVSAPA